MKRDTDKRARANHGSTIDLDDSWTIEQFLSSDKTSTFDEDERLVDQWVSANEAKLFDHKISPLEVLSAFKGDQTNAISVCNRLLELLYLRDCHQGESPVLAGGNVGDVLVNRLVVGILLGLQNNQNAKLPNELIVTLAFQLGMSKRSHLSRINDRSILQVAIETGADMYEKSDDSAENRTIPSYRKIAEKCDLNLSKLVNLAEQPAPDVASFVKKDRSNEKLTLRDHIEFEIYKRSWLVTE